MIIFLAIPIAFVAGLTAHWLFTHLKNRKRVIVIESTPHPFDDGMRRRIDLAARTWAARDPNPYAERVARPWVESFIRTATRESRNLETE
jgi:hypothetical protein